MGVKDLWGILDPAAESCTLADLQGKCLAVDISSWIFQSKGSQALAGKEGIRPHLRILFWRLYHLARNQVRLVVVFDGACPNLKICAVRKRTNNPTFSGSYSNSGTSKFRTWVEECKELLSVFKIPFLVSEGDAEALCAHLNKAGLVDGCITEDSDAFLFGARTVYRHFSCDPHKANDLKCYRMDVVTEKLKLSRNHLISMALLLGCDYNLGGVKGIGKEHAVRLMQLWEDVNPLEKLSKWRQDTVEGHSNIKRTRMSRKPVHCRICGHAGSGIEHKKTGCSTCGQTEGCVKTLVDSDERICHCEWHRNMMLKQSCDLEVKVKEVALQDPLFPRDELIKQYLGQDASCDRAFDWPRPSFPEVEKYVSRLFKWDQKKIRNQLAAYFTAFDIGALVRSNISGDSYPDGFSRPDKILELKKENHRDVYVVEWRSIPDLLNFGEEKITTREFKENFSAAFPQVAANYEGWLSRNSSPAKSPNRKRQHPETPQGRQTTMERYCVARKRLFLPLPTVSADL